MRYKAKCRLRDLEESCSRNLCSDFHLTKGLAGPRDGEVCGGCQESVLDEDDRPALCRLIVLGGDTYTMSVLGGGGGVLKKYELREVA